MKIAKILWPIPRYFARFSHGNFGRAIFLHKQPTHLFFTRIIRVRHTHHINCYFTLSLCPEEAENQRKYSWSKKKRLSSPRRLVHSITAKAAGPEIWLCFSGSILSYLSPLNLFHLLFCDNLSIILTAASRNRISAADNVNSVASLYLLLFLQFLISIIQLPILQLKKQMLFLYCLIQNLGSVQDDTRLLFSVKNRELANKMEICLKSLLSSLFQSLRFRTYHQQFVSEFYLAYLESEN